MAIHGRMGSKPGLGGQVLWRPKPWLSMVFSNYGMGEDTLGNGDGHFGRSRIHTDGCDGASSAFGIGLTVTFASDIERNAPVVSRPTHARLGDNVETVG